MIRVSFNNGVGFIYDVDDWFELRTKHRIVGQFFGSTRTSSLALPVTLCPEEIFMLVKKGIIILSRWNKINTAPSNIDKTKYEEELKQIHEEQRIVLREERRTQLETHVDKIIDGKKNKESCSVPREDIIQKELDKLPELKQENIINQIYTQHPDYLRGDAVDVPLSESEILAFTNECKCIVFEDLWAKGYYVTCGRKFGGDFLVYLGDPITFHAVYIVKCVENIEQSQPVTEIVAQGRLGNAVKKKFVLAGVENKQVTYLTLSWIDTEFH